MRLSQCFIFLFLLLCSCGRCYLSVKREPIDQTSLASTFVGSPDPRQKSPPKGLELILEWILPGHIMQEEPTLVLSIIYKNHTEEKVCYPIMKRWGTTTYSVVGEKYQEKGGLLTYKAEIIGKNEEVIKEWKQQLWVDLIAID
ncbi:MAG: hypothetical protein KDK76_03905 [Chlamydiia bacterium]|nr:hypothetical protein [Chlamydiia bacterium]